MLTWWRRAKFSSSTAARERNTNRKTASKVGKMVIETEFVGRPATSIISNAFAFALGTGRSGRGLKALPDSGVVNTASS